VSARTASTAREHRIFIYGSLLRGESAHDLISGARFLGETRTEPAWALVGVGWYPGLVSGLLSIEGELYGVDPELLVALDDFEDHPELFVRSPIRLDDGSTAETYRLREERAAELPRLAIDSWRSRSASPLC
jgi:gamma-glutamylcyclotransferase (GGCT)/AIG2-like uncharacterized protein YtfP